MTISEIENRIKNIEIALSALASKTYNRDSKAETNVSDIGIKASEIMALTNINIEDISEINDICGDIYLAICEMELGL